MNPEDDVKPYWRSEITPDVFGLQRNQLFTNFTKILLARERRVTGQWQQFLVIYLLPTFLNTWNTIKIFQESAKQSCFKHMQRSPNCFSPCFPRLYFIQTITNPKFSRFVEGLDRMRVWYEKFTCLYQMNQLFMHGMVAHQVMLNCTVFCYLYFVLPL